MNVQTTIQIDQKTYLRTLSCADVTKKYVDWLNDYEVTKFTEQRHSQQTFDTVTQFVQNKQEAGDEFLFGIFYENQHVGNVKLGLINWHHLFADISYFIGDKNLWGKGIASKSVSTAVWFGTKVLGLKKIRASYYENNTASAKVLRNCGFKVEGIRVSEILFEGNRINAIMVGYLTE